MRTIRIFLSSPGDCSEERNAVHDIVSKLNSDPLVSNHTTIDVVAWDWGTGVPLDAICSPQTSVNQQLPAPETCDVFIGIFRCRFGSPLPTTEYRKDDGGQYLSGSEYEFHRAFQAKRLDYGRPHHIWLYRWSEPREGWLKRCLCTLFGRGKSSSDRIQINRLNSFFDSPYFKSDDAGTGSAHHFDTTDSFASQLESHLRKYLSQWSPNHTQSTESWLKDQTDKFTTNAGPRYTADAHVATDIGKVFDWLLMRENVIKDYDSAIANVWKHMRREPEFEQFKPTMEELAENLRADPKWKNSPAFEQSGDSLSNINKHAVSLLNARNDLNGADGKVSELRQITAACEEAQEMIATYSVLAEKRVVLFTGPAGQGKTHTLVHEVNRTLKEKGVAVGVLGQELTGNGDLWTEIKNRLDIEGTTATFLDRLENEAASRNCRALICVDALNETADRSRWKKQLLSILCDILQRPHLTVVLSIRSDYIDHVLPQTTDGREPPWVIWQHPGLSGVESQALVQYFAHYGVKAPIAPPSEELGNALYVQLLAKSLQGRDETSHWSPSWLEVWSAWIEKLEKEAIEKLTLDPSRPNPVRRCLNKLAESMVGTGSFVLNRNEAEEISINATGNNKIIAFLCSTGALLDRVDGQNNDVVEFSYERLSDTFIINQILDNIFSSLETQTQKYVALEASLSIDGVLYPVVSPDWIEHPLSYRRAGLLKALCLAIPTHVSAELPELLQHSDHQFDWELFDAFTDSLHWRSKPNEFTANLDELWNLWRKWGGKQSAADALDELIGFSLIPGHPFGLENILHPYLHGFGTVGERDANWSIPLVSLWHSDTSSAHRLIDWSISARLEGIHPDVALPVAKLLAWMTATSQRGMRDKATHGLTRILVSCPGIAKKFLPDFLRVDDPYIVESTLIATQALVSSDSAPEATSFAAYAVYEQLCNEQAGKWCHITIRHYARKIVELACEKHDLTNIEVARIHPPYSSSLPLDAVPDKKGLLKMDGSRGFGCIVHSSTEWDFYRYIMGGNSGSLVFSSTPMPTSTEPPRPFSTSENRLSERANPSIFDLALAARFVAWSCIQLGWTADRFDEFDTGHYTRELSRHAGEERTERVGKKYQWISWYRLLAFLADNYEMTDNYSEGSRKYEQPGQIGFMRLVDPTRWISTVGQVNNPIKSSENWTIPSLPNWPDPNMQSLEDWIEHTDHLLPVSDVLTYTPNIPDNWGDGPWLNIAVEHIWSNTFAPGLWGVNQEFSADIWWQASPRLIARNDLSILLASLDAPETQAKLRSISRVDHPSDSDASLTDWPNLKGDFSQGLHDANDNAGRDRFPVNWMPLVGLSGHPDDNEERGPVLLPWPYLFKLWDLTLDVEKGVVRKDDDIIFGIPSWTTGGKALPAHANRLNKLIVDSGYQLVWWSRGERRAFLDWGAFNDSNQRVCADLYALSFLGPDLQVHTAWFDYRIMK